MSAKGQCTGGSVQIVVSAKCTGGSVQVAVSPRESVQVAVSAKWQCTHGNVSPGAVYKGQCSSGSVQVAVSAK
jgi:hypothetical protein